MAVLRRVYHSGNSFVVAIPKYMLEDAGVDPENRRVILTVVPGISITVTPFRTKPVEVDVKKTSS